ncbi:unnamed protein product [Symbiodinium sp. CCMP2592]|nr:unnamed protein product [Symbiodinium sp. CCMP2592]
MANLPPDRTVWLGGLPSWLSSEELYHWCCSTTWPVYAEVAPSGHSLTFGYVIYSSQEEAEEAVTALPAGVAGYRVSKRPWQGKGSVQQQLANATAASKSLAVKGMLPWQRRQQARAGSSKGAGSSKDPPRAPSTTSSDEQEESESEEDDEVIEPEGARAATLLAARRRGEALLRAEAEQKRRLKEKERAKEQKRLRRAEEEERRKRRRKEEEMIQLATRRKLPGLGDPAHPNMRCSFWVLNTAASCSTVAVASMGVMKKPAAKKAATLPPEVTEALEVVPGVEQEDDPAEKHEEEADKEADQADPEGAEEEENLERTSPGVAPGGGSGGGKTSKSLAEKAKGWAAQSATEDEGRDQVKARKYRKLCDSGAIPSHIQEAIEKSSSRSGKSKLINALFVKDGNGQLVMNPKDPVFSSTKTASHENYGKDERLGKPRHVFLWETYHGNESALQQGIDTGAVDCWTVGGVEMCSYRTLKSGMAKKVSDNHNLHGGEQKLSKGAFGEVSAALDDLSFDFDDAGSHAICDVASSSASGSKAAQKMLESGKLSDKQRAVLVEAKEAVDKLHGTGMKMAQKCKSDEDRLNFKAVLLELKDWSHKQEHALAWDELPSGEAISEQSFAAFVKEQAAAVTTLNEKVEQFRALLKTRKEL